jgi:hypothetical protein
MIAYFASSDGVIMLNVLKCLNVMDMLRLSMASTELLKFVDSYCIPFFTKAIKQYMQVVFINTLPYSVTSTVSQNGNSLLKATVNTGLMKHRLKTLSLFHLIEGLVIPISIRIEHENKLYMFEQFKIEAACASEKTCRAVQRWENVREYTFYLKSTITRINEPHPMPHVLWHLPRFIQVSEPTLELKMENVAMLMDNERTYFVRNCLCMCSMCHIESPIMVTYDRVSDEKQRRICRTCRGKFFVRSDMWRRHTKDAEGSCRDERLRKIMDSKELKKIGIGYAMIPYCTSLITFFHTEDLAKFAGFADWKKMTSAWEGWLLTKKMRLCSA